MKKDQPKPTTGECTGEELARRFHVFYESLAPEFGYETRKETRDFDPTTPNGRLMIAVCSNIADDHNDALDAAMSSAVAEHKATADYFENEAKEARAAQQPLMDALERLKEWHSENGEPRRIIDTALANVKEGK